MVRKHRPPQRWNRTQLKRLLSGLKGKKVLVVGDVGVDRYTLGGVERISPEAPVPILKVGEERHKLGLAANVADNIKVLGGVPMLTGVVGQDRCADDFRRILKQAGISTSHLVKDAKRRTVLKERLVGGRQQLLRVDYESSEALAKATEKKILAKVAALLPKVHAVVLEDYGKGSITPAVARGVFDLARAKKKWVFVDPPQTVRDVTRYKGASVLTPNKSEAQVLSGVQITDAKSLALAGKRLLEATEARHVVITLGGDGMAVFTGGSRDYHLIPTVAQEVFDVSGAGDTVIAVLALAHAAGAKIEDAAILGNVAAGLEVAKLGTATVNPKEISESLASLLRATSKPSV